MVLMSLKIDPKLVGIAAIILGLFLGFYVDNTILSKPRIEALTNQTLEQEETISNMEGILSSVQSEYDTLEALYEQLNENNVPVNIYETLQNEAESLGEQISSLEDQVETLSTSVDELEEALEELNEDYDDLTLANDRLQERFDEVYNPGYVAFTLNGYDVNLTVSETKFPGNTPIQGTMTIRKSSNNSPFEGTFKLKISKVHLNVGSASNSYEIYGETDYSWTSAFVSGAGSYKLSFSEILDSEDVAAIPSYQLGAYYINIFMG